MAGHLAPSLNRLWYDIDARWPNRDHRTDGWYASPSTRKSIGHNPGHNGYSHAIDIDKDGIDQMWLINNIAKEPEVLWYIIWNRTLYSATYDWIPRAYHGENPHTDHLHIEIRQTDFAEKWPGRWRIKPPTGIPKGIPDAPASGGTGGTYSGDFGVNYNGRDYRDQVVNLGTAFNTHGNSVYASGKSIAALRR